MFVYSYVLVMCVLRYVTLFDDLKGATFLWSATTVALPVQTVDNILDNSMIKLENEKD